MLMQFAQSAKRWGDSKADLGLFCGAKTTELARRSDNTSTSPFKTFTLDINFIADN
jgi:hypothetical protein